MSEATVASAAAEVLLAAISDGSIAAGVAADIARRVTDRAAIDGVPLDDLGALLQLAARV